MAKKWLFVGTLACMLLALTFYLTHSPLVKLELAEDDWRRAAIAQQLQPFAYHTISQEQIKAYKRDSLTYLYVIENGQLTVTGPSGASEFGRFRNKVLSSAIEKVLKAAKLPNMAFLLHVGDYSIMDREDHVPMFVFSKSERKPYDIMIPDVEMFTLDRSLWKKVLRAIKKHPWSEKQNLAFWRGATTGGDFAGPHWKQFPRAQLISLSNQNADVDAQFTAHIQGAESNPDFLSQMGECGEKVAVEDHLAFKYLVDIDGNASTYSRYFWILLSNSVPVKVVSHFSQWYYAGLEPYVHYVPVNYDCANLMEQISWLKTHEDEAKHIAEQSHTFARKYLSEEGVHTYLYHLLKSYGSHIEYNKGVL